MLAAFLLCAVLALMAWLIWACDVFSREAVTLNLTVRNDMAKLGDTLTATISPKNAAGDAAPVFGAAYVPSGGYEATESTDGLSAVLVAVASGTGFSVTVTATSKHGVVLTETVPLPDVDVVVDDEAVTLNLAVA
jgi:hypothetical protein